VLVQVWNIANRLCSKLLIPSLPMFLDTLERHEHLRLMPECRSQLLSMSTATADRLLRPHRGQAVRGLCTTRAGTLLKSNIPIRTFEQWDEQRPGFVEADLVAHCGSSMEGTYLFTLTLTDIATGWTECLPLLSKSAEAVLVVLQRARSLFPFPLLGLDTDNGTEFMNEVLFAYYEQEHITFTRGRPLLKNDQCYVEQKNGHIVRQVVGYDRFVGAQAYQHMDDLYRVLSQYVNWFQPSMKLCAKLKEGRRVRRIYDEAKTPLMRLLQAQVVPAEHERDLRKQFEDLDPVRLLEQAQQAQQTLFCCVTGVVLQSEKRRRLLACERFCVVGRSLVPSAADAVLRREFGTGRGEEEQSATASLLEWHRTCNDPFQEQWDLIAKWVCVDPTRSCRAMFEELRRLSPDHYQPSHLRTLQRGVRKIRARLPDRGVPQQENMQNGEVSPSLVSDERVQQQNDVYDSGVSISTEGGEEKHNDDTNEHVVVPAHIPSFPFSVDPPEERASVHEPLSERAPFNPSTTNEEQVPETSLVSGIFLEPTRYSKTPMSITIEEAIRDYLEAQQRANRRPKTIEWHETALGLFGQYLQSECQCVLLTEMTEEYVREWMGSLEMPTALGLVRSANTRRSYARSAHAWCQWVVNAGYLRRTPFATISLPQEDPPVMRPLETEEWERLLLACHSLAEGGTVPDLGAAWGESTPERKGYRNGTYTRDLATSSGPIEGLEVPRDREGQFHTQAFDRYKRYEPQVAEGLTQMFVAGVSTHKVGEVAQTLMGVAPSASTISRLNQTLTEQFETWRERPLQAHYRIMYLDGVHFNVRHGDQADSTIILTALGVDLEGNKEVLALRACAEESKDGWMDLLHDLRTRGATPIDLVVTDGHDGLLAAVSSLFTGTLRQRCVVHKHPSADERSS